MKRILVIILFVGISINTVQSQKNDHIGVLFNVSNTTLRVPNGEIFINTGVNGGIGEGTDATGYNTNIMLGAYGTYAIDPLKSLGLELFYDKTSSKGIEDIGFSALNLVFFIDYDPFDINFFLNVGVGTGYILNEVPLQDSNLEQKKSDLFAKASLAYQFDGIGRIEVGIYPGVREIIEDYVTRSKYYVGIKLPISMFFK